MREIDRIYKIYAEGIIGYTHGGACTEKVVEDILGDYPHLDVDAELVTRDPMKPCVGCGTSVGRC